MFKYILLILISIYNIVTNIYAIIHYSSEDYVETISNKPWLIRIPYTVWYWLETIYRYGLIPYLIRIVTACIIACGLVALSYWLPTKSLEAFAVLYAICMFNAGIVFTYVASWIQLTCKHLYRKRQKRK